MFKVMIVDNEAAIRKGLCHCIRWESLDCEVTAQAGDGIEALEQIRASQPDIVISDIKMPGMDGLHLAEELSRQYPQIKTIILTGYPDFEYAQKAISYRVVDFVLKPTSVENLTAAIEKAKSRIFEEQSHQSLSKKLEDESEQNLQLQRSMLLHDLIQKVNLSSLYVLNRMAQLRLCLNGYYVLRMVVTVPDTEAVDCLPYLQEAQSILTDCMEEYPVYFVPRGERMCYAVVVAPETQNLAGLCRETVGIVGSLPRFTLSIGLSRRYTDPLLMAQAAEEAGQAQQFADYSSEQPVMSYEQMPAITPNAMEHIIEDLKLIKSAIENQNLSGTRDMFRKLFLYIRETKIPVEEVRNICVYIYNFCVNLLFLCNAEGCMTDGSLPTIGHLLENGTIDAIEEGLLCFAEAMIGRTHLNPANLDSLILTIKNHINQHYMDDLSLESLASMVHLSPSYLSKLFKKELGENISTYVQNTRIEKAKTLLKTTSLKTYEVAERVGITDPVYFSRIFKKVTGLKPKEFRTQDSPKQAQE